MDMKEEEIMDYPKLIEEALLARDYAYTPYSHFKVGAALLGKSGAPLPGLQCRELFLWPDQLRGTNCCVQSCIGGGKRVSSYCHRWWTEGEKAPLEHTAFPCGVCRQVLAEFCSMDFPVIVARSPEDYEVYTLGELLPKAFTPSFL